MVIILNRQNPDPFLKFPELSVHPPNLPTAASICKSTDRSWHDDDIDEIEDIYWWYILMIEERLILFVEQIGGFGKFFSAFSTILCNHPICVPISWKMLKNILQQKLHRILRRPLRPGFNSLRQPSPCLGLPFHPYLGIKVTTSSSFLYIYSLSLSC